MVSPLLVVAAAILPISIYLIIIWRADRYEREPIGSYIGHVVWGATGAIGISLSISAFYQSVAITMTEDFKLINGLETIVFAPFYEEFAKASFLVWSASRKKFDNLTDGLVYGAAIGLGFAMTENFIYFTRFNTNPAEWISLVAVRSLFSGVMHGLSTGIIGGVIGGTKFHSKFLKLVLIPLGLLSAILVHASWNFLVVGVSGPSRYIFILIIFTLFVLSFFLSIRGEKRTIFNELNEEVANGLLPEGMPEIISSSQRDKKGWIDEEKREPLLELATRLAFRKKQYRALSGDLEKEYFEEIQNLRTEIKHLLAVEDKDRLNVL